MHTLHRPKICFQVGCERLGIKTGHPMLWWHTFWLDPQLPSFEISHCYPNLQTELQSYPSYRNGNLHFHGEAFPDLSILWRDAVMFCLNTECTYQFMSAQSRALQGLYAKTSARQLCHRRCTPSHLWGVVRTTTLREIWQNGVQTYTGTTWNRICCIWTCSSRIKACYLQHCF